MKFFLSFTFSVFTLLARSQEQFKFEWGAFSIPNGKIIKDTVIHYNLFGIENIDSLPATYFSDINYIIPRSLFIPLMRQKFYVRDQASDSLFAVDYAEVLVVNYITDVKVLFIKNSVLDSTELQKISANEAWAINFMVIRGVKFHEGAIEHHFGQDLTFIFLQEINFIKKKR